MNKPDERVSIDELRDLLVALSSAPTPASIRTAMSVIVRAVCAMAERYPLDAHRVMRDLETAMTVDLAPVRAKIAPEVEADERRRAARDAEWRAKGEARRAKAAATRARRAGEREEAERRGLDEVSTVGDSGEVFQRE